jgi:hypothetical protein
MLQTIGHPLIAAGPDLKFALPLQQMRLQMSDTFQVFADDPLWDRIGQIDHLEAQFLQKALIK